MQPKPCDFVESIVERARTNKDGFAALKLLHCRKLGMVFHSGVGDFGCLCVDLN